MKHDKREKIPILLDTDIGSDIDDALCLAYLLQQPQCELLGITTVSGKPKIRAKLARAICHDFGRDDVQIHSGTSEPLILSQKQPDAPQGEVLTRCGEEFEDNTALEFLRETIRKRPGEIVLLAIGPMTNIGLLFASDPEIPSLLKGLVLMCGSFMKPVKEWNAICDPHALSIVYKANVKKHLSIGLDVTRKCFIPTEHCIDLFRELDLNLIADMMSIWARERPRVVFHDPLAAAVIFEPDLCKYKGGRVEVDLQNEGGVTHWIECNNEPKNEIAVDVDSKKFFKHFFQSCK